MKKFAMGALLALGFMLGGCASNTVAPAPSTGAGGNWEAQLQGSSGNGALLNFVSNFSVGYGGGTFTINSFSFINSNSCFATLAGENGSAILATNSSNQVTGTLTYTVTSGGPSVSTLTLTATPPTGQLMGTSSGTSGNTALQNGVAYGTWSLSGGTNCNDYQGTFVMCQQAVPNGTFGSTGCGAANAAEEPRQTEQP
jgi:hypothetical protein